MNKQLKHYLVFKTILIILLLFGNTNARGLSIFFMVTNLYLLYGDITDYEKTVKQFTFRGYVEHLIYD